MTRNLVIVESPAKAQIIAKYLNASSALKHLGSFVVVASMGHIRDLSKDGLGIDINAQFHPCYIITPEKQKTVSQIKHKSKDADVVWLASDFDREGEAIAMHLKEVLALKTYHRITFTEITPKALEEAVLNPRLIDEELVDAQETRRILDRLVGFKLSPLLWKQYKAASVGGLSAGRVQSAVLHIILDREKEITTFESAQYWHFHGEFTLNGASLTDAKLYRDATMYKEDDIKEVQALMKRVSKNVHGFKVIEIKSRVSRTNADAPFTTSTLQQEASAKLGFTLKRTMALAQELYEKGYITYMRTDSTNISKDFKAKACSYILREYGDVFLAADKPSAARKASKKPHAQEAHEAIRPTRPDMKTLSIGDADHRKLYELIWKRTMASMMSSCVKDNLDIKIVHQGLPVNLYFLSTLTKIKFNGFMVLYGVDNDSYNFENIIAAQGGIIKFHGLTAKNTWHSPPQRFTESSIIKVLEAEGIGRPSTYATIMGKLLEKNYVIKKDIHGVTRVTTDFVMDTVGNIVQQKGEIQLGSERSKLVPSEIGTEIDRFLVQHFPYIVDKHFTSTMEGDLDRIAQGSITRVRVLEVFWRQFGADVEKLGVSLQGTKKQALKLESREVIINDTKYIVRMAKYGPVIEYEQAGAKKFIGIKAFLKIFRKDMKDVDEGDIKFLTELPKKIVDVRQKPFLIAYGPYGFYGKYDNRNIKLPFKVAMSILNHEVNIADIEKAIDYAQSKKKEDDSVSTVVSSTVKPKRFIKKKK